MNDLKVKLLLKNLDLDSAQVYLDVAQGIAQREILVLRQLLSKASEASLRHELLARLDSLQILKSKLNISELELLIKELEEKGTKLNVN